MKAAVLFGLLALAVSLVGQPSNDSHRCKIIGNEPGYQFQAWLQQKKNSSFRVTEDVYKIPVVVHIIHTGKPVGQGFNLSEERVLSQIRILNEDFGRIPGTNGFNEHQDGADARIEFALAQTDPEGNPTNGIVRIDTTGIERQNFGDLLITGAYYSFWDPNQYLNIWVIPVIENLFLGQARFPESDLPGLENRQIPDYTIPGFSEFHGIPTQEIDGVFVNTYHFGLTTTDSPYRFGRTATHEIGHFLGLFHVWGDDNLNPNCESDDYCTDTPPTASRASGCKEHSTCDGSRPMIENYMDYSDDDCMNIFTQQQVARMRTVLENSPRRKSLPSSPALEAPETPLQFPRPDKVVMYPNPVADHLTIKLPEYQNFAEVLLYDLAGNLVLSKRCSSGSFTIEIPDVAPQTLLIRLMGEHLLFQQKLVVK